MNEQQAQHREDNEQTGRRDFLRLAGVVVIGGGLVGCNGSSDVVVDGIPASVGYILVDTKKCQGCLSCMLACSLVHEGQANLTLSRIQVIQNSFEKWPSDITIEQCRQCVDPACVKNCPKDALVADSKYGNIRTVDLAKCIGCGTCEEVCPYTPSRSLVAAHKDFEGDLKSRKCDLCAYAQHHWSQKGGGPGGKQACIEVCPVGAIKFTKRIPIQKGDTGYKVNLRGKNWKKLGYPTS